MFISTAEKAKILNMIQALEVRVIELEGKPISEKPKRIMTEKHKNAIRAALKKRHEKAKAAKAEISGVPV
jgi:hypothetical protein